MNLKEVKKLIKKKRYDKALHTCERLMNEHPELRYELMRQKSWVYSRRAEYKNAVAELSTIIDEGEATLSDYDTAAFWALHNGQFHQALEWYLIALNLGKEQNREWYKSNELYLIAYIYMELGEYEKALTYLNKDDTRDKDGSFLIPNKGFCEVNHLRNEILRRMNGIMKTDSRK